MYEHVKARINKVKQDNERILITGDFNAKVGDFIPGNKTEVTKSGKLLLKMALEQELMMVNKSTKCQGKWTRILGEEQSILDYFLIFQEDEPYIDSFKIDEDKEYTPRYKEKNKTTYSDHCAIISTVRWTDANIDRLKASRKKVMTQNSLVRFHEMTQTGNLANIMREESDLSTRSVKWLSEVQRIMDATCEIKNAPKDIPLKIVRKMTNLKKRVRGKREWAVRKRKRQLMRINEIIEEEIKQHRARIMIKKAKNLQSDNKMHSGTFWEFKKQMDRMNKGETPSSMLDKDGKEKTTREEIKIIFEDFYPFKHNKPTTEIPRRTGRESYKLSL